MSAVLHLASGSPRRRQILDEMGVTHSAAGVDLDETRLEGESPEAMVLRLAAAKAEAAGDQPLPVLGADTAVVLGEEIFGKPVDQADALAMLSRLSGRRHAVMTGVAVRWRGQTETALSVSTVQFREISPDEALRYWQSGEPADKAGSYAIQGEGSAFVTELEGSYSGVVGLPKAVTQGLLQRVGIHIDNPAEASQ